MPSHRADTPPDAPTTLRTRSAAHPPQQRRRDLRAHDRSTPARTTPARTTPARTTPARTTPARSVTATAGLSWLDGDAAASPHRTQRALPSRRELHRHARASAASAPAATAVLDLLDRVEHAEHAEHADTPAGWGALALDPLFLDPLLLDPARRRRAASPLPAAAAALPVPPPVPPAPGAFLDERAEDGQAGEWAAVRRQRAGARRSRQANARRGASLGLPQVGIAGALGIATIAVPLTGAFAVAPPAKPVSGTVTPAAAAALAPLPPFPLASRPPVTALDDVRLLPDEAPAASVPARLAAPRVLLVGGSVSRSNERPVLPGCDGQVSGLAGVQNGQLPASMLCTLWDPRRQLRADAAVAIAKLNVAYQQHFGHVMCFNDAYRSLAQQYKIKAERGGFAARPGTSEHGWGLAVDLCDGVENGPSSPAYQWLRENAPFYGWSNPTWARSGGAGPYEPWHWEYFPGEKDQSAGD